MAKEAILAMSTIIMSVLFTMACARNIYLNYYLKQFEEQKEYVDRLKKEYELYISGVVPKITVIYPDDGYGILDNDIDYRRSDRGLGE